MSLRRITNSRGFTSAQDYFKWIAFHRTSIDVKSTVVFDGRLVVTYTRVELIDD